MRNIDWSKAPEGATHYMTPPSSSPWRDLSGETWKWWDEQVGWKDSEESSKSFFGRRHDRLILNPSSWTGEGLPPVGTVCEVTTNDGYNWRPVKILFLDEFIILAGEVEGKTDRQILRLCDADVSFRAVRTPEQIAAEKVSKQLENDLAMYGTSFALANDDGSITRLDPTKIVMRMRGAK
jgi:hypothetical protein